MKIKDRFVLGLVSGFAGNIVKIVFDELSLRQKISQRSFRSTAAGIWVKKKKHADSALGQLLGALFDFGFASMGGVAIVYFLSKTGRDHLIVKGVVSGIIIGSLTTFLLSAFPKNKVAPKDAASNLSYMLGHAFFGIVTAGAASCLGHPSIYDTSPHNNYMSPTEITTEEKATKAQRRSTGHEGSSNQG